MWLWRLFWNLFPHPLVYGVIVMKEFPFCLDIGKIFNTMNDILYIAFKKKDQCSVFLVSFEDLDWSEKPKSIPHRCHSNNKCVLPALNGIHPTNVPCLTYKSIDSLCNIHYFCISTKLLILLINHVVARKLNGEQLWLLWHILLQCLTSVSWNISNNFPFMNMINKAQPVFIVRVTFI
jgi:hypothetical protein